MPGFGFPPFMDAVEELALSISRQPVAIATIVYTRFFMRLPFVFLLVGRCRPTVGRLSRTLFLRMSLAGSNEASQLHVHTQFYHMHNSHYQGCGRRFNSC